MEINQIVAVLNYLVKSGRINPMATVAKIENGLIYFTNGKVYDIRMQLKYIK